MKNSKIKFYIHVEPCIEMDLNSKFCIRWYEKQSTDLFENDEENDNDYLMFVQSHGYLSRQIDRKCKFSEFYLGLDIDVNDVFAIGY